MSFDYKSINVLVVGDLMIDNYVFGTSTRLSPEAPVPVVVSGKEYSIPGGAGNVAMNLCAMGANVKCLGVVGDDIWGDKLLYILKNKGVNIDHIDKVKDHPTTLKQRIYSNGEQVARLDTEKILEWNPKISVHKLFDFDVCIISDYNKGVIKNANIDTNILIVDPKKDDFSSYQSSHIITPNLNELQRATNIKLENSQSIVDACNELIRKYNFNYIVAKRGDQGMTIVGKENFVKHIKAHNVDNPDVTGAGDTVISALSMAYAKTKDIELAARFANAAAAAAVSKPGTATVTIDEINNYIETG